MGGKSALTPPSLPLLTIIKDHRDAKAQSSSEEEESSEEDSSEDEEDPNKPEMTREQRRAAAKAKKEAAIRKKSLKAAAPGDMPSSSSEDEEEEEEEEEEDDLAPANPNHTAKSRNQASAAPIQPSDGPSKPSKKVPASQLSRREREALEKEQAKERYDKLHAAGKTDEARADLARLSLIKEKREQEAARKKAEKEEREAADKERQRELDEKEKKKRDAAMGGGATGKGGKKKP